MSDSDLIERLNERLGSVQTPMMEGENLAIVLCGFFENPDQDCEDDTGWTPDGIKGQDEVLDAIRAHYRPMADRLQALSAEVERYREALHRIEGGDDNWQLVATQALKGANAA
jgi:hypothetical protein